jgi:hypothetical protein
MYEQASSDAIIIAELHKKATDESVDLENRTQAEIVAVTALRDSAVGAAEAGELSRQHAKAAMEEQLQSIEDWKRADAEATVCVSKHIFLFFTHKRTFLLTLSLSLMC